jgi:hypothetical protein
MASNRIKLWINAENGVLYDGWQSNSRGGAPVFTQGDNVEVELHFVQWTIGSSKTMYEVEMPVDATIRMAIGRVDTAPTAGSFVFNYDGDMAVIPFNATATAIQTALNILPSIIVAGGVTVTKTTASLIKVSFNVAGGRYTPILDGTNLSPPCATKVVELVAGTPTKKASYALKVKQAPVVYNDYWYDIEVPTIELTTLIPNRGQRISITPEPKAGSWSLTGTANIADKVSQLTTPPDQAQLNAFWAENVSKRISVFAPETDFNDFQYDVKKVDSYTWDFGLKEDYVPPAGFAMPMLVSGAGLTGFTGKTATINFNTAEVEYLLDGVASAVATLEIEVELVSGAKLTVLQTSCTIKNDLIDQTAFYPISYNSTGIGEAPVDGIPYVRKNASWVALTEIDGGTY